MSHEQYQKLINTNTFDELVKYSNQFDLFKMMGVRSKELVHSNILAVFFTPSGSHGLGHNFVNKFLNLIPKNTFCGKAVKKEALLEALNANVRVYRELESIDLVIEFPEIKLVIGIENKVWAGEQGKQLERYQETLITRYPHHTQALIFLTPDNREPTTHNQNLHVPIYCMSYADIANCLSVDVIDKASDSVKAFISQFIGHIEKYLANNKHMDELCWKIFKDNEEAYSLMMKSYTKCIYRKVEEQFDEIQEKVTSDIMFVDYQGKLKMSRIDRKNTTYHIISNLDIKHDDWPEGVSIRVYKWSWMGCFPCIKDINKESVKANYPQTNALPFDTVKYLESEKISYFSTLEGTAALENRKITSTGNEITEADISLTLSKIKEFIGDINKLLRLK